MPPDARRLFDDFKTNAELYAGRLDYAGKKFKAISAFGWFYVWVQGFALPMGAAVLATYLLLKYGTFSSPTRF